MSEIVNLTTLNYVFSFLGFMDCCGTEGTTNDLRFSDFGFCFSENKNCTKLMLPSRKKNGRLFMSSWECLYKQSSKIRMENASSQVKIFSYIVLDRLLALISAVFPASNKCSHKQVVFWNPVLGLALRHRRFHISLLASKTLNSVT